MVLELYRKVSRLCLLPPPDIVLLGGCRLGGRSKWLTVVSLNFFPSPHMRRLYGNAVRKDAGVTKTLRNARRRSSSSGLHHVAALDNNDKTTSGKTRPHHVFDKVKGTISKNVKEVQGTVEKVLEETADALEEFLSKSECSIFFSCRRRLSQTLPLTVVSPAGPAVKGYVEDTKLLLQQSGERLVIR